MRDREGYQEVRKNKQNVGERSNVQYMYKSRDMKEYKDVIEDENNEVRR